MSQSAAGSSPVTLPGGSERRTAQLPVKQSSSTALVRPRFRHASPRSPVDRALGPEPKGRRFESCRGRGGVTEWLGTGPQSRGSPVRIRPPLPLARSSADRATVS